MTHYSRSDKRASPIVITYFQPDAKKSRDAYVTAIGAAKNMDVLERVVVMFNGTVIPFDEIISIDEQIFGTIYGE